MAYEFYLGIDRSEKTGKVAVALVEKAVYNGESVPTYHVRSLEQRDGNDEQALARYVQNLIADEPYVGRTILMVNRTGKRGRRMLEGLVKEGLTAIGATLSGGDSVAQTTVGIARGRGGDSATSGGGFVISEHELIETIEDLYREGRLKMEHDSVEVSSLADGIQSYEAAAPEAGAALNHIDAEARREGAHDGLVISTALACWYGEQHSFTPISEIEEEVPTTGPAKRMLRPDTTA